MENKPEKIRMNFDYKKARVNQKVIPAGDNQILWRNGVYQKIGDLLDVESFIDLCEDAEIRQESKIKKMKIALWILGEVIVILAGTLVFLLI